MHEQSGIFLKSIEFIESWDHTQKHLESSVAQYKCSIYTSVDLWLLYNNLFLLFREENELGRERGVLISWLFKFARILTKLQGKH